MSEQRIFNPNHGDETSQSVRAMLRKEEDGRRRHPLQARLRSDQAQRLPDRAVQPRDPPVQDLRAGAPPREAPFRRRRHEDPRQRRWSHFSGLRDSSEHCESARGVLPEVC